MGVDRRWSELPEAKQAAAVGDFGTLLRVARTAARLTLSEAGLRCGYSAATLSRIERGRQRLTDVTVLRRLAAVFDIPPELFGLADIDGPAFHRTGTPIDRVPGEALRREGGDDPVRRREVLGGLAGLVGSALTGNPPALAAPPPSVVTSLEDVLLGGGATPAGPVDPIRLRTALTAAWSDFRACRYAKLSARLPQLVTAASAGHTAAADDERATAATTLTQAYHLTIQVLVKLHEDAMAWSAMDRATQAARDADDPLLSAETARVSAIVLRRTHHGERAQRTLIRAAQDLDEATGLRSAGQVATYGRLLATAAYTAAIGDRRDTAWDLLGEAAEAGRRSGAGDGFAGVDVALYRISVARVLGDFGAAVQYARALRPDQLGSVERRARYWEDYALALHGRGAYAESFRALQSAEQIAPQEVRYRPWAQQLSVALLDADRRRALPGLRSFAAHLGTPT
ncbi:MULTISPECIES: helix-turn-helix domain-containing protein [Micromonospora]|uniref:XRE family transcriptional regulator n=1 Tax=Micromonospora solifontis TaxID=2487138 RepID=A0ABX9WFM4_9ACTN|nr:MULTISPECIES: helix-turn-helix transcriptional regulator [Micromonospora]NES16156.1 helix-turn-helix transcriptional regulator [Micromonospora sp. PPF5-17B]NES38043.1 helix-turn-helix transcriptional regulator [Micromonospora solifontis]NES57643.1 helix-turn-helix transcriptional regulator [Micromonospora sp. PPF5-6]RNL97720.1 XRE family transcriptional regulator [Micromonospora solifontis]